MQSNLKKKGKMADFHEIRMNWGSADLVHAFETFKQRCGFYFSVKDVKREKQVDHILLLSGEEGMKRFNSWKLTPEEAKDPDVVWDKFVQQIKPRQNFRVARLFLQQYRQQETETIDDFISRCKLQAQKCDFSEAEFEERVIEQLVAGTKYQALQKELLGKDKSLSLDQAIALGRDHEASIVHMKQLAEAQGFKPQENVIHSVKKGTKSCKKSGRMHSFLPRENCPAFGSTSRRCGKRNH